MYEDRPKKSGISFRNQMSKIIDMCKSENLNKK